MGYETGQHASEDVLELYALGRLPEGEVTPLEEHLLVCESCQDQLAETDRFVRAMRAALPRVEPQPAPRGWRERFIWMRRPVPVIAAAAAVMLIVWIGVRWRAPALNEGPPVAVLLETFRGPENSATAPAGRLVQLKLDASGLAELPAYAVEIVDAKGSRVLSAAGRRSGDTVTLAQPHRFTAGTYWVRLQDSSGALFREYALSIEKK